MTDPPPIVAHDGAVTIHGTAMLAATYRAVLLGIRQRRHDGLPTHDLQQLARELYRAHMIAMSPRRHENDGQPPAVSRCDSQNGDPIDTAAAARLLGVGIRQAQRLAPTVGIRRGSIWVLDRAAVLTLAAQRRAAK